MILDEIVAARREDMKMEALAMPLPLLERKAREAPTARDFHAALAAPGLSVIAEVKRASPSAGVIAEDFDSVEIARQYERGGASAVSVLTERRWFMGSNRYLVRVKEEVKPPVLRKDFIVDARQVVGARAIGADAILLIAAILTDTEMKRLYRLAGEYGLHVLFEAHGEAEVKRCGDCGARIIGVNNRDLRTMRADLNVFGALRRFIPEGTLAVAESGIRTPADARRMRDAGADAVLVGEALMRSNDIAGAVAAMRCMP
jgi:indole-3-glycerol phosphate synthase